jgi:hypothetical protein
MENGVREGDFWYGLDFIFLSRELTVLYITASILGI